MWLVHSRLKGVVTTLSLLVGTAGCGDGTSAAGSGGGTAAGGAGGGPDTSPVLWTCEADEVRLANGTCYRPGVPPEACVDGFENDGQMGCRPLLPEGGCEPGLMAVPGETRCRPVADCGDGPWGGIPVDATTVYVDASFVGTSTGSATNPYTSIQLAVDAAAPGAIVAIAEGTYEGDLFLHGKDVQLWGRCPDRVVIVGDAQNEQPAAIFITEAANGSGVHQLAITSPDRGVYALAKDVTLDRLWIHDCGLQGVMAVDEFGGTFFGGAEVTILDSLIESVHRTAVYGFGSALNLSRSVVRDVASDADSGQLGRGVYVEGSNLMPDAGLAELTLEDSVVRRARLEAVRVASAEATIRRVALMSTLPQTLDDQGGVALGIASRPETGVASTVDAQLVVIDGASDAGLAVDDSTLALDALSLSNVTADGDDRWGRCLNVQTSSSESVVTLARSRIDHCVGSGVFVAGSRVDIDSTVVADVVAESSGWHGYGITTQRGFAGQPPTLTVTRTLVHRTQVGAIAVFGGDLSVSESHLRTTTPDARGFGDGLLLYNFEGDPASGTVAHSRFADNARVGLALFGATAEVESLNLDCNTIALHGESTFGADFDLRADDSLSCGCGDQTVTCKIQSQSIEPPTPVQ